MATTRYELTTAWTQVVAVGNEFILENTSSYNVDVAISATAPAVDAAYHVLQAHERMSRLGTVGAVYARDSSGDDQAHVVVSTSA